METIPNNCGGSLNAEPAPCRANLRSRHSERLAASATALRRPAGPGQELRPHLRKCGGHSPVAIAPPRSLWRRRDPDVAVVRPRLARPRQKLRLHLRRLRRYAHTGGNCSGHELLRRRRTPNVAAAPHHRQGRARTAGSIPMAAVETLSSGSCTSPNPPCAAEGPNACGCAAHHLRGHKAKLGSITTTAAEPELRQLYGTADGQWRGRERVRCTGDHLRDSKQDCGTYERLRRIADCGTARRPANLREARGERVRCRSVHSHHLRRAGRTAAPSDGCTARSNCGNCTTPNTAGGRRKSTLCG